MLSVIFGLGRFDSVWLLFQAVRLASCRKKLKYRRLRVVNLNKKVTLLVFFLPSNDYVRAELFRIIYGYNMILLICLVCRIAGKNCQLVFDIYKNCWENVAGETARGGFGLMAGWFDACAGKYWYPWLQLQCRPMIVMRIYLNYGWIKQTSIKYRMSQNKVRCSKFTKCYEWWNLTLTWYYFGAMINTNFI